MYLCGVFVINSDEHEKDYGNDDAYGINGSNDLLLGR